jgi:succinyl-diaminopimelate desuccinylase
MRVMNSSPPSKTLALAMALIEKPSITPQDAGCIPLILDRLVPLGFTAEHFRFEEVDNVWIRRGEKNPLFVFLGHTDVVPPGPLEAWTYPPFAPTIHEQMLYGRGAVDMKGGIAAMIVAVEKFLTHYPQFPGSIAFLLTSDEEGPAVNGTRRVVEALAKRQEAMDWCIVGEPSSSKKIGDVVRNGRRGSLSGDLLIKGVQGHVAYPDLAKNPIHLFAPLLQKWVNTTWDNGNAFFQPTQFQIVHMQAGTGTYNVVPGSLRVKFNFRYSPEVTAEHLQTQVINQLAAHQLSYELHWTHSAEPFLTAPGMLLDKVKQAISHVMGFEPEVSTSGGTSDGRFIAPLGTQVVELGLCNQTLHQVNECVALADLEDLTVIYEYLLEGLFSMVGKNEKF